MRGKADEYPCKCIDLDLDLARATLHQWIGLGEKPPKMPGFARCAQVEAELRVAKKRLSHGLSLQYMNLTADRGQSAS